MMQSRKMSALEAITSTAIGFGVSLAAGAVVFPAFGWHLTLGENLSVTAIYTVISIVRGYAVRRLFNMMANHG
jgi:hypothetical protein